MGVGDKSFEIQTICRFCSTLAHIVRRYELLGDRRALNILNLSTKADNEDFDEDDFG